MTERAFSEPELRAANEAGSGCDDCDLSGLDIEWRSGDGPLRFRDRDSARADCLDGRANHFDANVGRGGGLEDGR